MQDAPLPRRPKRSRKAKETKEEENKNRRQQYDDESKELKTTNRGFNWYPDVAVPKPKFTKRVFTTPPAAPPPLLPVPVPSSSASSSLHHLVPTIGSGGSSISMRREEMMRWPSKQVAVFIHHLLDEPILAVVFHKHQINGAQFLSMTHDDFLRLGLTEEGAKQLTTTLEEMNVIFEE